MVSYDDCLLFIPAIQIIYLGIQSLLSLGSDDSIASLPGPTVICKENNVGRMYHLAELDIGSIGKSQLGLQISKSGCISGFEQIA